MDQMFDYVAADREFYAPLEEIRDDCEAFRPSQVPDGWREVRSGVWTMWRGDASIVERGWKVHVSASIGRARPVLELASAVCFAAGVPFKHLSNRKLFWWVHQKYAHRAQAGKFIAAYPPDVDTAREVMERLREALAGEDGPYILSDRRFPGSRTVHYRYGAFKPRSVVRADGTRTLLVRDGVPDVRGVRFQPPEGMADPFAPKRSGAARPAEFGGFAIDASIQFTNAGGIYRGRELATDRRVFIKEARPHTGLRDDDATATEQLREEWQTLVSLHELAPGLAPQPISYFRAWEHEFLVMEHIDGRPLARWTSTNHPLLRAGSTVVDFAAFYARAERVIAAVERALERLHRIGYLYVDVSPANVLVDADDGVRLVDFGSAHRIGGPFLRVGTPGYAPPPSLVGDDLSIYDSFGVSRLAQHLLGPLQLVLNHSPEVIDHLRHELAERAPVPDGLWRRATAYHPAGHEPRLPTPERVAADPVRHLTRLRDQVADALLAMADAEHPARVFPTVPQGYQTNTVCVAYGTAGVVHALRRAGRPLPDGVLDRLRRDALDQSAELGPGLYVGTAGIAQVLAGCGLLDEGRELLAAADRHPLLGECATLYGGAPGVALSHLALYRHTRDEEHLDRATAIAAGLPPDGELAGQLGADDATGLMYGRCGVAYALAQVGGVTGDDRLLRRAVRLLHAELDRASEPDAPGLLFPVSAVDRRAMPYLFIGSAGMVHAAARCLRVVDDDRLAEAMPRMLATVRLTYTLMPGLCQGLAGHAFTLADHALLSGDETSRHDAVRVARGLFKYAVPHDTGVRYLGDKLLRFSGDLWSGSAGVLLALDHVLDPRPDALFTVDSLVPSHASRELLAVPA